MSSTRMVTSSTLFSITNSTTVFTELTVDVLRNVACLAMFTISFVGIGVNGYCFYKMWGRERYRTMFHLLNRTRMVSNCVILAVFVIWVIPSTAMNRTYLPHIFNQFFGQLAGWGAYWMGPSTQICISITRFIAAYFPFFYRNIEGGQSATILIVLCLVYCTVLFGLGMPDGCSFEYDPEPISFLPNGDCANGFNTYINVAFTAFFIITTVFNVITAIRIIRVMRQVRSINDHSAVEKERRNWKLLAQNTTENLLYVFDVYVVSIRVPWYDEVWYQFVVNTVFWQAHVMLDGFIVLAYNRGLWKGTPNSSGTWARHSTVTRSIA